MLWKEAQNFRTRGSLHNDLCMLRGIGSTLPKTYKVSWTCPRWVWWRFMHALKRAVSSIYIYKQAEPHQTGEMVSRAHKLDTWRVKPRVVAGWVAFCIDLQNGKKSLETLQRKILSKLHVGHYQAWQENQCVGLLLCYRC
jgi:Co/Zn/Cd efflux system component